MGTPSGSCPAGSQAAAALGASENGLYVAYARKLGLAKSYLIGSFPLRLDTSSKVAGMLIGIEENGLGLDYPDRFKREVARVTVADVQRVAKQYLNPATFSSVKGTKDERAKTRE